MASRIFSTTCICSCLNSTINGCIRTSFRMNQTYKQLISLVHVHIIHRVYSTIEPRKSLRTKIIRSNDTPTSDFDATISSSPYIANAKKQLDFIETNEPSQMPDFPSDIEQIKLNRLQERHAKRPGIDPNKVSILLFPSQGNEYAGMCSDLLQYPNVVDMFKIASRILKLDLLSLCTDIHAPASQFTDIVTSHTATLVTSLAAVEMLKHQKPWAIERCIATAGFCVGEYAALVFAGVLQFEDAVKLVQVRAKAMQSISDQCNYGQLKVTLGASSRLKLALHTAREVCRINNRNSTAYVEDDRTSAVVSDPLQLPQQSPVAQLTSEVVCQVAAFLAPQVKLVSGDVSTLEFLEENFKEFGILSVERLPSSTACHTKLMYPVKTVLKKALQTVEINKPAISVHSNFNGKRFSGTKSTIKFLSEQVTNPICWEQILHILYSRKNGFEFPHTYALMPGYQGTGQLLKLTNTKAIAKFHPVHTNNNNNE